MKIASWNVIEDRLLSGLLGALITLALLGQFERGDFAWQMLLITLAILCLGFLAVMRRNLSGTVQANEDTQNG